MRYAGAKEILKTSLGAFAFEECEEKDVVLYNSFVG